MVSSQDWALGLTVDSDSDKGMGSGEVPWGTKQVLLFKLVQQAGMSDLSDKSQAKTWPLQGIWDNTPMW